MSILYKTDGSSVEVSPKNGTDFQLEELQAFVGGLIEILPVAGGIMVVNEEGKLLNLPFNKAATDLVGYADYIVGDVLVCPENMVL